MLTDNRRLYPGWSLLCLLVIFVMGRIAFCSDRYKLTTVLIEAPGAAQLSIDGRLMEWCKHEHRRNAPCHMEPHDGVRVFQWALRLSLIHI